MKKAIATPKDALTAEADVAGAAKRPPIRAFTDVLNLSASDASSIKAKLQPVVGGLATEFETTLVALITAVVVQLLSTWVFRREEILLDEVTDYCNEHVLSRLKLTDWQ
jgi:hypothetical protein